MNTNEEQRGKAEKKRGRKVMGSKIEDEGW
jgi:hypothetical protein